MTRRSSTQASLPRRCVLCLLSLMAPAVGCQSFHNQLSVDRLSQGYALILPGILGEQGWDHNVASALERSTYAGAIEVRDWTLGPLMFGWNMFDSRAVDEITDRIQTYQVLYPGRPVFLIGHSGGCRMVVQTLESLPEGAAIEKAVLLAPCMSSKYDLRLAMSRTRSGICAFSSGLDIPISVPLTGLRGLAVGELCLAAATVGFRPPDELSEHERQCYQRQLQQHRYSWEMLGQGHPGGHFGWTTPSFISAHVVPQLVVNSNAGGSRMAADSPAKQVRSAHSVSLCF